MECVKNVERLVSRCEDILGKKIKIRGQDWRIVKYVQSLNERLAQLEISRDSCISVDQLTSFKQRVSILQEIVREQREEEKHKKQLQPVTTDDATRTPIQRTLDTPNLKGSGLLRRTVSSNTQSMRKELLGKVLPSVEDNDKNIETALLDHQKQQEKIAQDMIEIAKSLKHQSLAARDIIKSDTKLLEQTTNIADDNVQGIKTETDRLEEKNKGCSWIVWIMLIIVFIVFIQMVVFIRLFPKRK